MRINFSILYCLELLYQKSKSNPDYWYCKWIRERYGILNLMTSKYFDGFISIISNLKFTTNLLSKYLLKTFLKYEKLGREDSVFFSTYPSLYFESREKIHEMIRYDKFRI